MQAQRDLRGLELRPLGWRVSREITRDGHEDVPTFHRFTPFIVLTQTCFEHLESMKLGIFAHHRAGQRRCQ